MEAIDRKQGKVIDKILSFKSLVDDYQYWVDHKLDRRDGYIVGNGRVNAFLNEDDVEATCKELELSPRQIIGVREEFDNDRLWGIWNHTCEVVSDQYTDWLLGCTFSDYYKRVRLYGQYLRYQREDCKECHLDEWEQKRYKLPPLKKVGNDLRFYHKEFQGYFEQGHTQDSLRKYFEKEYADEIRHLGYLKLLDNDSKRVWGGKYPVITSYDNVTLHEDIEIRDLIYQIERAEGELTNKKFYDTLLGRNDRCQTYDSVKEVLDIIDCWTEKFKEMQEAVAFVEEYIDAEVKYFGEYLKERLEDEITRFIEDNFSLEERIREGLSRLNYFKEIRTDEVVTDQNAHAPIPRIKQVIKDFEAGENVEGQRIGNYTINRVFNVDGESYFKIGCHLFKLSDVKQKLAV